MRASTILLRPMDDLLSEVLTKRVCQSFLCCPNAPFRTKETLFNSPLPVTVKQREFRMRKMGFGNQDSGFRNKKGTEWDALSPLDPEPCTLAP